MNIAILGSGNVGTALATGLIAAGHTVVFGSRAPGEKTGLVAPVSSLAEAVSASDLVIHAGPGATALDTLGSIGADTLGDRILVDVSNASGADGLSYPNDSVGRQLQAAFPRLRVVKTLNTMNTSVMTNPSVIAPTTVFVSGDDASAKNVVADLLVDLGWPRETHLDLGGIVTARGPEHYFLLFFPTLQALGTPVFNIAVTR